MYRAHLVLDCFAYLLRAIIQACDIRLHRSFVLAPNPRIGRKKPIRVAYSDVGFQPSVLESATNQSEGETDIPTLLFAGGQFGGRYQAYAYDEIARAHKVRFLAIDRPGIGGTQAVPLDQRIGTWLDMVPALLAHIGVKYVHLACHSAGTIFVVSTILRLRHLLHPTKPYIAFLGPWVPPSVSGKWTMATVSKLPESWICQWHHIARFMNNNVAPVITASGMAWGSIQSTSESKTIITETSQSDYEETLWKRASESVITRYIFAEDVEGSSHEALLCLQKGNVKWGNWQDLRKGAAMISSNEKTLQELEGSDADTKQKLRIRLFFAEEDEMVGRMGQTYLENCFAKATDREYLDFHSEVVQGTDHNEVLTVSRGAIEKIMKAVSAPEMEADQGAMSLRDVLSSPLPPPR